MKKDKAIRVKLEKIPLLVITAVLMIGGSMGLGILAAAIMLIVKLILG